MWRKTLVNLPTLLKMFSEAIAVSLNLAEAQSYKKIFKIFK